MIKRIVFVLTALFLTMSCQDVSLPEAPENLLSKQKMMAVLADAYISGAARTGVNNRILRNKRVRLDSLLYATHRVDSLSFAQSNAYYAADLDTYAELVAGAQVILKAKKKLLDSTLNSAKKKKVDTLAQKGYQEKYGKKKPQLTTPPQDK